MDGTLLPDKSGSTDQLETTQLAEDKTTGVRSFHPTVLQAKDTITLEGRSDVSLSGVNLMGFVATVCTLMNMIVGSGIISLPSAVKLSGAFLGPIGLLVCAIFSHFTIFALAQTAALTELFSYYNMVRKYAGRAGGLLINFLQLIYPLFALITYLIAVLENTAKCTAFFGIDPFKNWYTHPKLLLAVIQFVFILPISSFKSLSILDKASMVSMFAVMCYAILIIYDLTKVSSDIFLFPGLFQPARVSFVEGFSIIAFALSCQHNVPQIFHTYKARSASKFNNVAFVAIVLTTILYNIMAITGFAALGGHPGSNILEDFCEVDKVAFAVRILFSLTVILTAPLQIYGSRRAFFNLVPLKEDQTWARFLLTFLITCVSFACAIGIPDIQAVFSFSGALIAAPIIYVIPAALLIMSMQQGWLPRNPITTICLIVLGTGCVVMVLGTVTAAISASSSHVKTKYYCSEEMTMQNISIALQKTIKAEVLAFWRT